MLRKWLRVVTIHNRQYPFKQAFVELMDAVWLAMVAYTQSELPYFYEKEIRVAKKRIIDLFLFHQISRENLPLFQLFSWILQLNELRRLLADPHLLRLSFEGYSDLHNAIKNFFLADTLEIQQICLQEYEEAYWRFESFYHQVILTAAHDAMPWHAWTRHLKIWNHQAQALTHAKVWNQIDTQKRHGVWWKSWYCRKKSFKFFSYSLHESLHSTLKIFSDLSHATHMTLQDNCAGLISILQVRAHPLYPDWVFKSGFNPGLRASWRFFLLELEKYLDLTLILLSNLNQLTQFLGHPEKELQDIFITEEKLFLIFLKALHNQALIDSDIEIYSDIEKLSDRIMNPMHQFTFANEAGSECLDGLRFYYCVEQRRVAILNLLHAFPIRKSHE